MTWWPGWDTIDGAKWWSDFYFWFGIVCLFLLGISEVISHRYGLRKDELVIAAERAAETRRKAEVEGLQKQLSESDKKVADIQSQQIPRRLSPEQKATLLTSLAPFAGQKISIWCSTNAWDCVNFATDFQSVFKQAKWDTPDTITFGIVTGYDAKGIEVLVNPMTASDPSNTPPPVVTLITTLVSLRLMAAPELGRMAEIEPDTIFFRIGRIHPE
jgi:hypothetical protein